MAKKEKKKMFDEVVFTSVEEAEKALKREKIMFIVIGIGTLLALVGTIMFCAALKKGGSWDQPLVGIGLCIGVVGELVACLVYKVFKYWLKFIGIMGVIIPVLGLLLGFVLGAVVAIYFPAVYAVLAFKESYDKYKAAKAYLTMHVSAETMKDIGYLDENYNINENFVAEQKAKAEAEANAVAVEAPAAE